MCVDVKLYDFMRVCIHAYRWLDVCMNVYMYACMHACKHVHIDACMQVCIYALMHRLLAPGPVAGMARSATGYIHIYILDIGGKGASLPPPPAPP